MKKKILITGSGGFIMSNYVRRLVYLSNKFSDKYNYVVSSLDSVKSSSLSAIYTNKNHSFHIADLTDKHILDVLFKLEKPDIVIHGATINDSSSSLEELITNNIVGTENLFHCCNKYNVNKIINITYHNEFNNVPGYLPLVHKWQNDIINYFNEIYGGNFIKLKLPFVFGPRQDELSLIPFTIFSAMNDLEINFNYDIHKWLHVFDACSAINNLLDKENESKETYSKEYGVFSGNDIESFDLAKKIYSLLGKDVNLVTRISGNNNYRFFNKLHNCVDLCDLNWKPNFTNNFDKSLQDTVEWYVKKQWFFKQKVL